MRDCSHCGGIVTTLPSFHYFLLFQCGGCHSVMVRPAVQDISLVLYYLRAVVDVFHMKGEPECHP